MPFTYRQSVAWVIHLFVGLAGILLMLRFFLRFFNANPDASFVHWCYTVTAPLLEPLRGIFPSAMQVNRGWVVDYIALFALVMYAAAGYILANLLVRWTWTGRR